ncbi:MAG: DUF4396 domain-containing protein [Candidatus Aquilonibacter sp.]
MTAPWLNALAIASLVIAFACAAYIIIDVMRRPQRMAIMNWVWPITALYAGPLAVWAYCAWGNAPAKPYAAGVAVDVSHCGAGCTLGDIVAESVIFVTGWSVAGSVLVAEYIGDYALAYTFGIVFQYFAIAPMRGLSFWPGIWAAIKADTLSLTAFEIGLFGWMALMNVVLFHPAPMPNTPAFWFMMQIGMIVGFITAYPMNWWLVKVGIKEPM